MTFTVAAKKKCFQEELLFCMYGEENWCTYVSQCVERHEDNHAEICPNDMGQRRIRCLPENRKKRHKEKKECTTPKEKVYDGYKKNVFVNTLKCW